MRCVRMAAAAVAVALATAGCGNGAASAGGEDRLQVVAGFYPLAEAAQVVGGDAVEVTDLTPAGSDPHDVGLRPGDVARIRGADLVLYLGGDFQPAIEDAIRLMPDPARAVDLLGGLPLRRGEPHDHAGDDHAGDDHAGDDHAGDDHADEDHADEDHADDDHGEEHEEEGREEEHGDEHGEDVIDPHVWLDPTLMADVVARIAEHLGEIRPEERAGFEARAAGFTRDLEDLDRLYAETLATCERREVFTSHAAFGYLTARYDLEQIPIAGLSPEVEPSPRRLQEVATRARERGATVIFFEMPADARVSEAIARAVGARTAVLTTLESLTPEQEAAGGGYGSLMRANLEALAEGLGCERSGEP